MRTLFLRLIPVLIAFSLGCRVNTPAPQPPATRTVEVAFEDAAHQPLTGPIVLQATNGYTHSENHVGVNGAAFGDVPNCPETVTLTGSVHGYVRSFKTLGPTDCGTQHLVFTFEPVPTGPVAQPAPQTFSAAQIKDLQGDLMVWCPEIKPRFTETRDAYGRTGLPYDPGRRIFGVGDNGAVPNGIVAGWVWSTTIDRYPAGERAQAYACAKRQGATHWALHVARPVEGSGYHGIFPIDAADVREMGGRLNQIHGELLAAGLIPLWAGVAPDAPATDGLDRAKCLASMTDWDNSRQAEGRLRAVSEAFPGCAFWYELPPAYELSRPETLNDPNNFKPTDDRDAPLPDESGGEWIRRMRRQFPAFVGVLHEVNAWEGSLDQQVQIFTALNHWWHDLPEWAFETDTYAKFWFNRGLDESRSWNDRVLASAPWLKGSFSGATFRPPPAGSGDTASNGAVGDQLDAGRATWTGGPNIGAFARTATITRLELRLTGVHVEFTKQAGPGRWPDNRTPGWTGDLQYSMGLCMRVPEWTCSAPVELWAGLDEAGGPLQKQSGVWNGDHTRQGGQIEINWFYDRARWGALVGHQPAPGEEVGFFVVAGDPRNNFTPVPERSNIVVFKLPADGVPATLTWSTQ